MSERRREMPIPGAEKARYYSRWFSKGEGSGGVTPRGPARSQARAGQWPPGWQGVECKRQSYKFLITS